MRIWIKNGRILDPASRRDEIADLYVEGGKIAKAEKGKEETADRVIDAGGCYVVPGLIDLHVHLRDPGQTYKEDVETGGKAAAAGGFTTIVAMPNTKPVIDCDTRVSYVLNKAKEVSPVHVLQAGAITMGQKGEELTDIRKMAETGILAISEDGKSVMNSQLYREAMQEAADLKIPVLAHCEDIDLVNGGCMNDDEKAREFGLPGITNSVENAIVARDIILAEDTGVHLHLCHCSTKESVEMVRMAKKKKISVSAEVCPHHFTLSTEDMVQGDANYKMNPPLRTRADVEALRKGLKDGTIEVISTDHAPHSREEKSRSMLTAPFGIVGLETSVGLTITELVKTGILTPMQMVEKMSFNPAKILHSKAGTLKEGRAADIAIIDPDAEWTVNPEKFRSKGKNTPFAGRKLKGKVLYTICDGRIVYEAE